LNQSNNSNQKSRLVLGTAQLGMTYGIANKSGKPSLDLAKQIIKTAWENGIREYDTAQGYGESEKILGDAVLSLGLGSDFRVMTKFDPNLDHFNRATLEKAVKVSLSRLNVPILHGLMLHKEEHLEIWEKGLGDFLRGFVTKGLTEHIGVSVYSPDKAVLALETDGITIVQLPSNIFDRRFEKAGVFRLATDKGKQIYVRSIFLQGLALMRVEELPGHMKFAVSALKRMDTLCNDARLTRQGLALGYVREAYPNAKILFGAEAPGQVEENMVCWNESLHVNIIARVQKAFDNIEEQILNPVFWGK